GVAVVIGTFIALVICVLNVAQRAMANGKVFASFATFGVAVMFAGQAFINVGVASGLLPTKGLTMPFISYGGSSLLASCALMALVMRIDWEMRMEALAPPKKTAVKSRRKVRTIRQQDDLPAVSETGRAA
uniref:FtsW/RodA/SpoVE family cell cycle protein n=1 Tax=Pseudomaricurvus sp. TaxID=2004510 RepID=UPI003F6AE089